jgi:hypothetical protein
MSSRRRERQRTDNRVTSPSGAISTMTGAGSATATGNERYDVDSLRYEHEQPTGESKVNTTPLTRR